MILLRIRFGAAILSQLRAERWLLFRNTLKPSGVPSCILKLKIGAPIMFLGNPHPTSLYNGTGLFVKKLVPNIIHTKILTGHAPGNDDHQVSEEALEFEDFQSENVLVPDQLLEEDEITLSIDECSVNADGKEEIEDLKRN
ncbi:unnamed protein product [Larinioides sclopetarius]|uniref:DNA helicase Pif1-like 2B domain-containing protein n=1 Tax=Larinioides sclopetarius TaxID=280406 RepID=A0AAV1ZZZ1_9ARAC